MCYKSQDITYFGVHNVQNFTDPLSTLQRGSTVLSLDVISECTSNKSFTLIGLHSDEIKNEWGVLDTCVEHSDGVQESCLYWVQAQHWNPFCELTQFSLERIRPVWVFGPPRQKIAEPLLARVEPVQRRRQDATLRLATGDKDALVHCAQISKVCGNKTRNRNKVGLRYNNNYSVITSLRL